MNQYTAVIKQDGKWWIGWIEEVPGVNCQEKTYEELLESLKITLGFASFFKGLVVPCLYVLHDPRPAVGNTFIGYLWDSIISKSPS